MTINEAFEFLKVGLASLYSKHEADLIAKYVFEDIISKDVNSNQLMSSDQLKSFKDAHERLMNYEPWQYVVGEADFYSKKFKVNSSVLIPRPETEELAFFTIQCLKSKPKSRILDIGTGSGAISITLGMRLKDADICTIDISKEALEIAQMNADIHNTNIDFREIDFLDEKLWDTLGQFDYIVSNPPYISINQATDMMPNVLNFEPSIALFAYDDPLIFYKKIIRFVTLKCQKSCEVLVEINEIYGYDVYNIFTEAGLEMVDTMKDMQGKDRFVYGKWNPK
ncbi:MAG: peptide chain release factor N(5)-glutamine methyltransferase [Saprospiraceae bacterium]|nr:peptide chain release factor N(5)-glutamine methyltransferase [Saprospiraceae bacterium]